jgi:hypothetical protein
MERMICPCVGASLYEDRGCTWEHYTSASCTQMAPPSTSHCNQIPEYCHWLLAHSLSTFKESPGPLSKSYSSLRSSMVLSLYCHNRSSSHHKSLPTQEQQLKPPLLQSCSLGITCHSTARAMPSSTILAWFHSLKTIQNITPWSSLIGHTCSEHINHIQAFPSLAISLPCAASLSGTHVTLILLHLF